ncbi:hypothetical protein LOAG_03462, partial [Loa loa]
DKEQRNNQLNFGQKVLQTIIRKISLYFKDSKTIEEGNTSQQAREHHFQENLGRPHTFIYNYILVQYLVSTMREQTTNIKDTTADGGMTKTIKYYTDGEAREQEGITETRMKPFTLCILNI